MPSRLLVEFLQLIFRLTGSLLFVIRIIRGDLQASQELIIEGESENLGRWALQTNTKLRLLDGIYLIFDIKYKRVGWAVTCVSVFNN